MIFLDTGAWLARFSRQDQYREQARLVWTELATQEVRLVTSNFVIDETLTLLARRTDYSQAAKRARSLYQSDNLEILRPSSADEIEAVSLFEKYADQKVSFTDCVSFALMKRNGLRKVFSFDRHFRLAGFDVLP